MIEDNPSRDRVIFLGAGASKSEKAPLQSDLFQQYCQLHDYRHSDLVLYFNDFFGMTLRTEPSDQESDTNLLFPTCEEALGVLEMAIAESKVSPNRAIISRDSLKKYQNVLILAISLAIARSLEQSANHRTRYHEKLTSRLIDSECPENSSNTAIISTNYDILIDDALIKNELPIDYGFDFRYQRKDGSTSTYSRPSESFLLNKIHGSLNWLYCPTCETVDLTPLVKSVDGMSCENAEHPTNCRDRMKPVIIPPTYMKDISPHFLKSVWESSENLVRNAKTLIFCGYSFPDADIHLKYMLKRAEMSRQEPLEIFVVNHHNGKKPSTIIYEYERYSRFLKSPDCFHYTRQSFESFCENGLDASDEFSKTEIDCMKLEQER